MKPVVHVDLGDREFGLVRLGGAGLANCMFFVARGIAYSCKNKIPLLRPTWERVGIGPVLRREKDKRFYIGFFKHWLSLSSLYKCWRLLLKKNVVRLNGWWNYIEDLTEYWKEISEYFHSNISEKVLENIPDGLSDKIALHIRRGDMPEHARVGLDWSISMVEKVKSICPDNDILLFSDGSDEELAEVLSIDGVSRAFFGDAMSDLYAMSKCKMIIGTSSSFSWFAAYLSQIPIIIPPKTGGLHCCHLDTSKYCVSTMEDELPSAFFKHIKGC